MPARSVSSWLATSLILSLCSFPAIAQKKGVAYRVVPLSTIAGQVYGMNADGRMVGNSGADPTAAMHWQVNAQGAVTSTMLRHDLLIDGQLVVLNGLALDISNNGVICGVLLGGAVQSYQRPVVWPNLSAAPQALPLPQSPTLFGGHANSICDVSLPGLQCVIVGRYIDQIGEQLGISIAAWAVKADGSVLPPVVLDYELTSDYETTAYDVNTNLAVVGSYGHQAWRWQLAWNGQQLSVAARTQLFPAANFSDATVINNQGDIAGTRNARAYLLENVNGTLVERTLPLLIDNGRYGTGNMSARALDNSSTPRLLGAVDVYRKPSQIIERVNVPVLWQGSSVMDLQQSITPTTPRPQILTCINDQGWVAGNAWTGSIYVPVVLIKQ